jgi:hypothetical protein
MKKIKTLCRIKAKDFDDLEKKIKDLVREPTHVCRNCARAANKKRVLCNPVKLR